MRKVLLFGTLMMAAVAVESVAAQVQPAPSPVAASKIAYIHSRRLIEEAPGAVDVRTTLQREMAKYKADLDLLEDSIKNMLTDYQAKQVMLSPDAKKKQEEAIQAKQRNYETRAGQYEQNMQKRQQELVQPIMDRVNKAIEDLRKEQGIALVLDAANGSIISADTTLDLTTAVLNKLKASAPAASAPKKPGS